jgi:hypothetical protein
VSGGEVVSPLVEVLDEEIEETVEYRHKPTYPPDENGQGDVHVQFAFAAHRAVVEVDVELGLVRVVELATAQDVGKAMNPQALEGQIEGGVAQGLGLALLEEIQIKDGRIQNASFTDYLLPTTLDMPSVKMDILELADPEAPYGLKGRRRTADDLLHPGDSRGLEGRNRARSPTGAGQARADRRHRKEAPGRAPAARQRRVRGGRAGWTSGGSSNARLREGRGQRRADGSALRTRQEAAAGASRGGEDGRPRDGPGA